MGSACFDQRVPASWTSTAYPSLKPLGPWFKDLVLRLEFLAKWIELGVPSAFWVSGFYFPQGFLTAALQNFARKYKFPIDTVAFSFVMCEEAVEELTVKPTDGCYVFGMFLEGARWDRNIKGLVDPKPKELFSAMPVMHMLPVQNRQAPQVWGQHSHCAVRFFHPSLFSFHAHPPTTVTPLKSPTTVTPHRAASTAAPCTRSSPAPAPSPPPATPPTSSRGLKCLPKRPPSSAPR